MKDQILLCLAKCFATKTYSELSGLLFIYH